MGLPTAAWEQTILKQEKAELLSLIQRLRPDIDSGGWALTLLGRICMPSNRPATTTNRAHRQRKPWRNSTAPSRKQKELIRQLEAETDTDRADLSDMSSADRSDYIATLCRRKARQTLTDKQEIYLIRLGYEGPWDISVDEASALITQLAGDR